MKNLTIRTSLRASLLLFSVMFGTGAALGIFTVQRSNEVLSLVHKMSSETQAINDVYKDIAEASREQSPLHHSANCSATRVRSQRLPSSWL